MPSSIYETVWHAVRNREQIVFRYEGKRRECYPVILGYSRDGGEALLAYQFGGQTSRGKVLPAWRCFYLQKADEVSSRKARWLEGDDHKQTQACVQHVDVDANIAETLMRDAPLPFGSPHLRPPRGT